MLFTRKPSQPLAAASALPGRDTEMPVPERHEVLTQPSGLCAPPLRGPFPDGVETAVFGMGCFWGAERIFWQAPGVYTTAVGYAGGFTPNPTYEEVCSGQTGHAEVVLVAFDTAKTSYAEMLRLFWEGHDPTQGMRQGNDIGTQYRSAIYVRDDAQRVAAQASRDAYQQMLAEAGMRAEGECLPASVEAGHGEITTEIAPYQTGAGEPMYYAEDYHQQYLAKNPGGYCGLGGTDVACPIGLTSA
ncbi:MAG: peptide-methionine (S)-S-oxide reductase MsrA [Solirubrobacteraceae bacterium]|jgi:peptide-methionine (S)-S-oxide reductase